MSAETGGTRLETMVILIPFFGKWPEWINLFVESCKWNPSVEWLLFSDCGEPENRADNVRYVPMKFNDFSRLASSKLGINAYLKRPYKLCDFKPAYGVIFEDYIKEMDWWGFGDVDVIYGTIRKFITNDMLSCNLISFCKRHISGHFCLLKNKKAVNRAFKKVSFWESKLTRESHANFPEGNEYMKTMKKIWLYESYNTPLSPLIPWTDNSFSFPQEWYWKAGRLTNDRDGEREFPYLHFMHWKGGEWARKCGNAQWEKLERLVHFDRIEASEGFRVNERGFFKLV